MKNLLCQKLHDVFENVHSITANSLFAIRAYDSDKIVQKSENLGMKVVIPSQKNRKV